VNLAERVSDVPTLASAHFVAAFSSATGGRLKEAASHYEEGRSNIEQTTRQVYLTGWGILGKSALAAQLSWVRQLLGQSAEASNLAREALRQARDSRHLFSLGEVLTDVEWLYHFRRDPETLGRLAEEAIALSEENGFAEWLQHAQFVRGSAMPDLVRVEEGVAEMATAISAFGHMAQHVEQYAIACLAHGYARLGRRGEALKMLGQSLAKIEGGAELEKAEMLRFKGEALLMGSEPAEGNAEKCFRAAIDVARMQEAKWWELRATTSLARLLAKQGKRDEARAMLAEIYTWFTEGFDTADLKEAKALLDELDGR